jgi:hypothetical protein
MRYFLSLKCTITTRADMVTSSFSPSNLPEQIFQLPHYYFIFQCYSIRRCKWCYHYTISLGSQPAFGGTYALDTLLLALSKPGILCLGEHGAMEELDYLAEDDTDEGDGVHPVDRVAEGFDTYRLQILDPC